MGQEPKPRPLDREPRVVRHHQGQRTQSAPTGPTYDRRAPAVHRRNKNACQGPPLASTLRRRWHAQGSYGGPKGAVGSDAGANRMALGFLGEQGPEYLAPTHDRPRRLIKTVPTKMLTWDGVEWARRYVEEITGRSTAESVMRPSAFLSESASNRRRPSESSRDAERE